MAQLFGPSANTLAKVSLIVLILSVVLGLGFLDLIQRSAYVRYTKVPRSQPVEFSHKHHTNMGIDCRYCHTTVEESHFAGVPPTRVCMNCHNQLFTDSELLKPVRDSWESGDPLKWVRVHDLPDFVYFNHSIHVNKGVGCTTCHGPIDEMPLTWKEKPLFMRWCVECHQNPTEFIRPRDEVFNMDYEFPENQAEVGAKLAEKYDVQYKNGRLTDCWICHR